MSSKGARTPVQALRWHNGDGGLGARPAPLMWLDRLTPISGYGAGYERTQPPDELVEGRERNPTAARPGYTRRLTGFSSTRLTSTRNWAA